MNKDTIQDPHLDSQRPTNVRRLVFILGCGTSWFLYLHRYTFALVKPKLEEEWNLDNAELGLLDSAFSVCYSAFQLPAGVLADATGAHLFLGGIILLWSIGLGLHAWAPNLNAMRAARAVLGLGQAGAFAAISRVTRTWFPFTSRTFVQGSMGVFAGRVGGLCANLLFATYLIGILKLEWRTATWILAGAGMVQGILFLLFFRNSPRNHPWTNKAEADLIEDVGLPEHSATPKRMSVRKMLSQMDSRSLMNLGFLILASSFSTIADSIYSNWIPKFLSDEYGLQFKEMGIYSALPLLGGACGGIFSGFLNDRMIRKTGNRRWTRSLIGFGGKGIAGVCLVIALFTSYDNPYRFCFFLFFVKFFADMELATRWGTVTDIGGAATASVFALNNSLAALIGMVAPPMYGWVADHFKGWYPVFIIAAVMYALCAVAWLLVDCSIPLFGKNPEDSEEK